MADGDGDGDERRRRWRRLGIDVRFWSLHSWSWDDRLADQATRARIEELATWLLDAVAAWPSSSPSRPHVVDVGCGTGNHSAALAAGGADVIGVDFAPAMLARAAAKVVPGTGEGPAFVRADLRDGLPMRSGCFDGAISVYAAQFFDLGPFLADVAAALRPGAALVLEVPRPGTRRRVHRHLSLRHRAFQRINNAAASIGRRAGLVRVASPLEVDAALVASGFAVVSHRDRDRSVAVLATLSA